MCLRGQSLTVVASMNDTSTGLYSVLIKNLLFFSHWKTNPTTNFQEWWVCSNSVNGHIIVGYNPYAEVFRHLIVLEMLDKAYPKRKFIVVSFLVETCLLFHEWECWSSICAKLSGWAYLFFSGSRQEINLMFYIWKMRMGSEFISYWCPFSYTVHAHTPGALAWGC